MSPTLDVSGWALEINVTKFRPVCCSEAHVCWYKLAGAEFVESEFTWMSKCDQFLFHGSFLATFFWRKNVEVLGLSFFRMGFYWTSLSVITLIARSACRLGAVGSLVHRLADCGGQLYDLWQSRDQQNS